MSDADAWSWVYSHEQSKQRDRGPEICFTGFGPTQRAELEAVAASRGYRVVQNITKKLAYLCVGPNAGPAKVQKAAAAGVTFLTSDQFERLPPPAGESPDTSTPPGAPPTPFGPQIRAALAPSVDLHRKLSAAEILIGLLGCGWLFYFLSTL